MGKLFKNIGLLTFSQLANYVLPLITIPYITRVVGPENYGLLEFGTIAMLYFSALVTYGFKTTATRKIAELDDIGAISKVFTMVVYSRLVLLLLASLLFLLCILLVPRFQELRFLMVVAFPITIGWALYPEFLFQGVQKLQYVALANFTVKVLAAILIFILLQSKEDFYLVLAINGLSQVLVGAGSLWLSFRVVKDLHWARIQFIDIVKTLKESTYIFLSVFFTRIYTFGSVIFLGFLLSEREMGLFSVALKLITVSVSFLFLPLSGALFPFLTRQLGEDPKKYLHQLKRSGAFMFALSTCVALILIIFSEFFVGLVFGNQYIEAAPLLQLLAPVLWFTTISHFCMHQGLIVFKKDKLYLSIIVIVGLLSLILNYLFIRFFNAEGAAYVKLIVEFILALVSSLLFIRILKSKGLV